MLYLSLKTLHILSMLLLFGTDMLSSFADVPDLPPPAASLAGVSEAQVAAVARPGVTSSRVGCSAHCCLAGPCWPAASPRPFRKLRPQAGSDWSRPCDQR